MGMSTHIAAFIPDTDKEYQKHKELYEIGIVTYGFLSLCNWSLSLKDWSGFSRFVLGAEGIIFLIKIFDEI